MKYDDRYIVELSRAAIFDDTPFVPEESVNWEYIYNKSIEQNIIGLLFTAVSKLSDEYKPDKELYVKWQQKMLETIAVTSRQYYEFLKMSKVVSDDGIKMVGLKGCVIRNLYPVPELRTMGDFDVLINESNISLLKNIFSENGYKVTKHIYGIEAQNKYAFWEIFSVLEEEFVIDPEKNTEEIYLNSLLDGCVYKPEITLFLAHIIIHTGKHYVEKGAGIRNLLDIALILKAYKSEIDFIKLRKICKEQNYDKIYEYIMSTMSDYFNIKIKNIDAKKNTELFMEYTLLNGIFGKHGNVLYRQMALDERQNSHGIERLLFPPVSTLKKRYKYLRKFPFLLPVAWIHRVIYAKFVKKLSIKKMASGIVDATRFSDERMSWLKKLDLIDKH